MVATARVMPAVAHLTTATMVGGGLAGVQPMGLLDAFGRAERRRCLSNRTIDGRRRTLETLVAWLIKQGVDVADACTEDIERWLDSCALGPSSRSTYLSTARAFYAWCHDTGHIEDNPATRISGPRVTTGVPRPINTADLARALAAADPRMRLWLCLGAYQGFRTVEMAAFSVSDVTHDNGQSHVIVRGGKGRKQRIVPLNPETATALRVYAPSRRGPMFRLMDGRVMSPQTISRYIGRYLHSLDIEGSAHMLRHWFGTNVHAQTHDIRVTQELLGHSSPATTAIYAAYSREAAAEAVQGLKA